MAAAVSHDHVNTVHAVDDKGRIPFLVMQYISDVSLQEQLNQTGPLRPDNNGITLSNSTLGGDFGVSATGDVTPVGSLTPSGTTTLSGVSILLADPANNFAGPVTASSTVDVALATKSNLVAASRAFPDTGAFQKSFFIIPSFFR